MKKNICIITTVHTVFDTRIFHKECKSLVNAGFNVTLIAQHDRNETVDKIKIIGLPKTANRFVRMTRLVWDVFRLALKQNADIYHIHDPELIPICVLLKHLLKAKIIYDVHEDYITSILLKKWICTPFIRRFIAWLFDFFEKKVFLREFDAIILAEKYYQERFDFAKNKCTTVLNYPPLSVSHGQEKLEKPKIIHRNSFNIIYSGGVTEVRGVLNVINGFIELAKFRKDIDLYLIGYLPSVKLYRKIVELLSEHNLVNRIQIVGKGEFIRREVIDSYYKYMNLGISLITAHPHYEKKLLTKFFEYMINGLPIIISNFRLWDDFINKNRCGITVNPLDAQEISKAIEYLIEHRKEAKEMGENGRKAVLEKYNWEIEKDKLYFVYKHLMSF